MDDEQDLPPGQISSPAELETGIFNLVVTLCKLVGTEYGEDQGRLYAATYLERLAEGLRTVGDADTNKEST